MELRKLILPLILLISTLSLISQEKTGKWGGKLNYEGMTLVISFNITENENGYSTTMDIHELVAKDIPVNLKNGNEESGDQ